jgi:MinD-like ATPase involved in chromosome partitioning or flagellar assembly
MDPKKSAKLQRHLVKAIIEVICKLGLKNLPLLPADRTLKEMAKAAVAVYEKAVDGPDDGATSEEAQNGL